MVSFDVWLKNNEWKLNKVLPKAGNIGLTS